MDSEKKLMNKRELAKALGVNPRTIYNYRKRGLPYIKLGARSVRYDFDEVVTWFRNQNDIPKISFSPSPSMEIK